MKIIVGIDPGMGARSATGICIYDATNKRLIDHFSIWPQTRKSPAYERIRDISGQFLKIIKEYQKDDVMMINESFVMRGKGGESLQRLIGSFYACSPNSFDVFEISNMQLKQFISDSGSGKADKLDVAKGIMNFFEAKENFNDAEVVMDLIEAEKWDAIDAIAIAIVGDLRYG